MKLDLLTSLYVFMLAAFIGFEVIRRVSPLLDVIDKRARCHRRGGSHYYGRSVPCAQGNARENPGNDRHRRGNQQHRRRIFDYRPDAEDVQSERPEKTMSNLLASDNFIEITYLIATALFILSLKWLSSPTTARRGVFAGDTAPRHRGIQVDHHRPCIGHDHWRAARRSGDDRGAAADGAEPRVWRAVRDLGGHNGILFAHAGCAAFHDGRPLTRGHPRIADVHWQPDGRGKIARTPAAAAHHL